MWQIQFKRLALKRQPPSFEIINEYRNLKAAVAFNFEFLKSIGLDQHLIANKVELNNENIGLRAKI